MAETEGAEVGFGEFGGLVAGADELVVGGTAPTAISAGFTDGAGPVVPGVGLVTVPGGPTADDGPGLGVGDIVTGGGGKFFPTSWLRLLSELPLCA